MSRRGCCGSRGGCSNCDPTQRDVLCFRTTAINIDGKMPSTRFFTVYWGDGSKSVSIFYIQHTYAPGEHTICVTGDGIGAATSFDLRGSMLVGSIPDNIGLLENVLVFRVDNNNLIGAIPDTIDRLSKMTQLYLNGNNLTGPTPSQIANLDLTLLLLDGNSLTGAIPAGIAAMSKMTYLWLHYNDFSQADMSNFVNELWQNRLQLGGNGCGIQIQGNNGLTATAIEQIEGTGAYLNDGLVQAGCIVNY